MSEIRNQIKTIAEEKEIPLLEGEIILIEELCHLLVKIDNYEHENHPSMDKTYCYQQSLIDLAREHNSVYGI